MALNTKEMMHSCRECLACLFHLKLYMQMISLM
jgi:hypothetical protein